LRSGQAQTKAPVAAAVFCKKAWSSVPSSYPAVAKGQIRPAQNHPVEALAIGEQILNSDSKTDPGHRLDCGSSRSRSTLPANRG